MGILEQLEAEERALRNAPAPDAWANSEDKLEEWIGLPPKQQPKKKKTPASQDPSQITIDLKLFEKPSDIYKPTDFKSSVDYARALKLYSQRMAKGQYAGYMMSLAMNGLVHNRRVFEPVRSREEALQSPDFTLAVTKGIEAILNYKR